jgi:hypothetical protein
MPELDMNISVIILSITYGYCELIGNYSLAAEHRRPTYSINSVWDLRYQLRHARLLPTSWYVRLITSIRRVACTKNP